MIHPGNPQWKETRFLVINPNTNAKVTEGVRKVMRTTTPPGIVTEVTSPAAGPFAIESVADKAEAGRQVLALIHERMGEGFAGYILACFDDIAIDEIRALTRMPVVSLAEAGIRYAHATGGPFRVITTFEEAVPTIKALSASYGLDDGCMVVATGIGVTDTAARTEQAEARLSMHIQDAIRQGATAIVLGSGAFAGRAVELEARYGLEVMDGFSEALRYVTEYAGSHCA